MCHLKITECQKMLEKLRENPHVRSHIVALAFQQSVSKGGGQNISKRQNCVDV